MIPPDICHRCGEVIFYDTEGAGVRSRHDYVKCAAIAKERDPKKHDRRREELAALVREEMSAISMHSGRVVETDDQIDVVVVEDDDAHYARAIERIVARILGEQAPERLPDDQ